MTTQVTEYDANHQFNIYAIYIYRDGWTDDNKFDLKNMMLEVNLFEDLFSGSMTAKIAFLDMTNLVDNFPIVGGERMDILYNSPSETKIKTLSYVVGSVNNREKPMAHSQYQGVILNLVTPERYKDVNLDMSMAFNGPYSEIVKSVISKLSTTKNVTVDPTIYTQNFISPYWSPLKCCRQIAERAMGTKYEPFFFYENSDGYNFRSVLSLYSQQSYCKLLIQPAKTPGASADKLMRKVIEYGECKISDRIRQTFDYGFGANTLVLDETTKRFTEQPHDYATMSTTADFAKIDKFPLVDNMSKNRSKYQMTIAHEDKSHEGLQYRQMITSLIDNYRYRVLVPGDSGYKVGQVLDLDIPDVSITKYTKEQTTSGRWIIGSLKHSIKRDSFFTTLELMKDSHMFDIAAKVNGIPKYDASRSATGTASPPPADTPSDAAINM